MVTYYARIDVRIVGCDLTKMTEAQAKELADAYREAITPANCKA